MARACNDAFRIADPVLSEFGMDVEMIGKGVSYTYEVLDSIDAKLLESGGPMLSELLELANLSAIIGNLFRGGIVKASGGRFRANAPHTYPDLLGIGAGCKNVEIKVALETNKPKGHLIKAGPHLTVRYVLGSLDGTYLRGKKNRSNVAWIWEVRAGWLKDQHFNFSNTEGDSGKTAVINSQGMEALKVVYCDLERCPHSLNGATYKKLAALFSPEVLSKHRITQTD